MAAVILGTLIGAVFGRVWLSLAGEVLPGWRATIDIAAWGALGVFVVAGALVALSVGRAPPQWSGERPRPGWAAWLGVVIAVEVALIAGGRNLLGGTFGHRE